MKSVQGFLSRFDAVRPAGDDQYDAACPAHEDRHQSLAIGVGDNGFLLHCHAGCDIQSIMRAAPLEWSDLFFSERQAAPAPRRDGVITITTDKLDRAVRSSIRSTATPRVPPLRLVDAWAGEIGTVAGRLTEVKGWSRPTLERLRVGWDGRRVTIPVFDGDGELLSVMRYLPGRRPKTLAVGPRELFPAPESVDGDDVWLVEGEPDAISGRELGLPTVSVPGVATWREHWAERLLSKRVTVCMDADREGRQCAADRVRQLAHYGVQAAVVDLAPDRGDGTDLGDLLVGAIAAGRVADLQQYLRRLADEAWSEMGSRRAA